VEARFSDRGSGEVDEKAVPHAGFSSRSGKTDYSNRAVVRPAKRCLKTRTQTGKVPLRSGTGRVRSPGVGGRRRLREAGWLWEVGSARDRQRRWGIGSGGDVCSRAGWSCSVGGDPLGEPVVGPITAVEPS